MDLFAPDDPRPIHFMGIAGAGMSALALIARRRGVPVTGCDTHPNGARELAREGADIAAGHDPGHITGARAVVYTAALPPDHPELAAARQAGVPVVRRADALADIVVGGVVIAVGGTHGKTTTTAMAVDALVAAGADPTGIVGGRVAAWGGNARLGGQRLFVVEADEFDRAFLALRPTVAVVTNVEADHLECYGSLAALEDAFVAFAERADRVIVGADDEGARRVAGRLGAAVWRVGTASDADLRIARLVSAGATGRSQVGCVLPDGRAIDLALRVPGRHNALNAAMALAAAVAVDADPFAARVGLDGFKGVGRRFEVLGTVAGVTVVDDYAHHPSEVTATLAAARERFPGARVVAVFQPHLYSRTQAMGDAMGRALAAADRALVTDVYAARERPLAGVTGELVVAAARTAGAVVEWLPERRALAARLVELVDTGDVVVTLGAGDVTEVGPELVRRLEGHAA